MKFCLLNRRCQTARGHLTARLPLYKHEPAVITCFIYRFKTQWLNPIAPGFCALIIKPIALDNINHAPYRKLAHMQHTDLIRWARKVKNLVVSLDGWNWRRTNAILPLVKRCTVLQGIAVCMRMWKQLTLGELSVVTVMTHGVWSVHDPTQSQGPVSKSCLAEIIA